MRLLLYFAVPKIFDIKEIKTYFIHRQQVQLTNLLEREENGWESIHVIFMLKNEIC